MRLLCALALSGSLALASGCAGFVRAPVVPAPGAIFTDVQAPLDVDYDNTDLGSRNGTAETTSILGLISTGDASIATAARNGGITKVKHADYKLFNVLGIFSRFQVIVYGD